MARDELKEELQGMKERLAHEVELRAKEGKEFADRLKEVYFTRCRCRWMCVVSLCHSH